MRFSGSGHLLEFNCLPFGLLCTAPGWFTTVLKPIINFLRMSGFMTVVHLVDWLCFGTDQLSCLYKIQRTREIL